MPEPRLSAPGTAFLQVTLESQHASLQREMETSGSEAGCAGWLRCASRGAVSHIGATAQRPREVAAGAAARDRDETRLAEIGRDGLRFPEMARDSPRFAWAAQTAARRDGRSNEGLSGFRDAAAVPLRHERDKERTDTRYEIERTQAASRLDLNLFQVRDVSETLPRHFRETPPRHSRGTPCVTPETRPRRARDAPEAAPLVPRPCREGAYATGARKDARAHDGGVRQEHPRASAQRLRPKARAADGRPPCSFRIDREASAIRSKIEQERRRRGSSSGGVREEEE